MHRWAGPSAWAGTCTVGQLQQQDLQAPCLAPSLPKGGVTASAWSLCLSLLYSAQDSSCLYCSSRCQRLLPLLNAPGSGATVQNNSPSWPVLFQNKSTYSPCRDHSYHTGSLVLSQASCTPPAAFGQPLNNSIVMQGPSLPSVHLIISSTQLLLPTPTSVSLCGRGHHQFLYPCQSYTHKPSILLLKFVAVRCGAGTHPSSTRTTLGAASPRLWWQPRSSSSSTPCSSSSSSSSTTSRPCPRLPLTSWEASSAAWACARP